MVKRKTVRKSKCNNFSSNDTSELATKNDEQTSQFWKKSLYLQQKISLEQDQKIIRMQNQINELQTEKNHLSMLIKDYEALQNEWSQEKISLTAKEQLAYRKALSYEKSMSFRLGYAIIFGFKSFAGFKQLVATIFQLLSERGRRKKNTGQMPTAMELRKPVQRLPIWKKVQPKLQWIPTQQEQMTKDFTEFICVTDEGEEILLSQAGHYKTIPCDGAAQIILNFNVYSKDGNYAEKQALLMVAFFDQAGEELKPSIDLPFSAKLKKYYFYLDVSQENSEEILLILPLDCTSVEIGFSLWDAQTDIYIANQVGVRKLTEGISVVVPTYRGEMTIAKCLDSLLTQTLDRSLFEILVVMNGSKDGTEVILQQYQSKYKNFDLKYFYLEEGNVSKARNFAVEKSSKTYVTFVDDDDYIQEDFLISLYSKSMYHTIVLTGIEDIHDGITRTSSVPSQLERAILKDEIQYNDVTSTLTMNACKLAPAHMVKSIRYDASLKSGEDVVYWSELLLKFSPKITLVEDFTVANYKRVIRDNSVSRQKESYDFNVWQRLEVITRLAGLLPLADNQRIVDFVQSKITAQASFIKRHLEQNKEDYSCFVEDIQKLKINNPVVGEINSLFADTLIVSYCYAPYIDTSGVVMSKRIRAMEKPVDIIFNNMDKVRPIDENLMAISNSYLGARMQLNAPQAFSNWGAIEKFSDLALTAMNNTIRHRPVYRSLYSRAMWPASHFAAAVIKMKYPQIKWSAEFSDPLLMDVSGKPRFEEIPAKWLAQHGFIEQGTQDYVNNNLFYWCEMLPYQFADELIFTNKNQLEYMLSYTDTQWHEVIRQKAVIMPQPTLDRCFYQMSDVTLDANPEKINLAYFGSFYVNRGFGPFMNAWSGLEREYRDRFKLYIYTQQDAQSILDTVPEDLKSLVHIQPYVGYFDFLKLTDLFDGLVVMDAETKGLKLNNPYLPSKLSDYLGSKSRILSLIEDESPMSLVDSSNVLKARINNQSDIQEMLIKLFNDN